MEAGSVISSSSSTYPLSFSTKTRLCFISNSRRNSFSSSSFKWPRRLLFSCPTRSSPLTVENPPTLTDSSGTKDMLPKIDKSGRFCSPRAARELALMILYAACLDGSDPVRLFEKRVNSRRACFAESGYKFDNGALLEYDHMSFGGPPVATETDEEAEEILRIDQKESDIEAQVLSAPPKLVYSKLILRFARKLLLAVAENWDSNVLAIDKVAPDNWKKEPAGRILEFSVLHIAMSEIAVLGTKHQIVINEAVDLAKRFCDGAAPRTINGCMRTFVKELNRSGEAHTVKIKQTL
ncbi:hypothetical protein ACP275_04G235700 [Erythranthe tilingii]